MAKYTADVTVIITVSFEDDGTSSLVDQAMDAVWDHDLSPHTDNAEIHQRSIKQVPA